MESLKNKGEQASRPADGVATTDSGAVPLQPISVDKPWGREVWYSGVEARGESGVAVAAGVVPLSRFLAERGRAAPVILLKALHPTTGNLYLEVHEAKSEVYIVEGIDGVGRMLLGARPDVLARVGDKRFRETLRHVASAAEVGTADVEAVRSLMNSVDLAVGDAVTIPLRVPHSLLRGVHVVEFQTPVFERRILAASQPVATQRGWDVDAAVAVMDLAAEPVVVSPAEGEMQVIARAPGFTVVRYRLGRGDVLNVAPWSVGWVVSGELRCRDRRFEARTAFLAPAATDLRTETDTEVLLATET